MQCYPPSQKGVQAAQALIPSQAVLSLSPAGVQAPIPRQAALTLSPAGV